MANVIETVYDLAKDQFNSEEFRRLLAVRISAAGASCHARHMVHYVANRRSCWAFVQGGAPLAVKRLIWEHEGEELIEDPRVGSDHYQLQLKEARALGVDTAEGLPPAEPWAQACFWAWEHLARHSNWLFAFGASTALEVRNSDAVIAGGALSSRMAEKFSRDTGVDRAALVSMETHSKADVEHAGLLEKVCTDYVRVSADEDTLLAGVKASFVVDRAFRGAMADAIGRLADVEAENSPA